MSKVIDFPAINRVIFQSEFDFGASDKYFLAAPTESDNLGLEVWAKSASLNHDLIAEKQASKSRR